MPRDLDKTILVVDDDQDVRDTLRQILEDEGYRVAAVSNGSEALRYLREEARPALILLDLMMPIMDGREFRQEQRRDATIANIPVVLISAGGNWREVARCLEAECVRKPIDFDSLLVAIERNAR